MIEILTTSTIIILVWFLGKKLLMPSTAPFISPTEFEFISEDYEFLIRRTGNNLGNLLIKTTERHKPEYEGVYEYKLSEETLTFHKEENIWDEATGKIQICERIVQDIIEYDYAGRGKHTFYKVLSPTGSKLAILTINGPLLKARGYFFSTTEQIGNIFGVRYFEIIDLLDSKVKYKTLRVKGITDSPYMNWTEDEEFVVITNSTYSTLAVVDVKKQASN